MELGDVGDDRMDAWGETYLEKARESLAGARSELERGRYSNAATRSYYAAFQAAIHAIVGAGIKPPGKGDTWDHGWVQGQFVGLLINRRHLYGTDLRAILSENYELRVRADYTMRAVSQILATRALQRAERFVNARVQREG